MTVEKLVEQFPDLITMAPEMDFSIRVTLTAEGVMPDDETLSQINSLLEKLDKDFKFR